MSDEKLDIYDSYMMNNKIMQKAVYDHSAALEGEEDPGNHMISFLGGFLGSVYHELYLPEHRDIFLEMLVERFNLVVDSLEGKDDTVTITTEH